MTRLRIVLRERNESLFKEVEHQVEKATPQLWHSYGTFPSGTKHTPEHTQMVETIAGWLLPDDLLAELSDDEIAFLILACHYHDLGMSGTEEDNLTADGRDQVRREHAVSIGDRILEQWRAFGFQNETTAEILAEICKGHRPTRSEGIATWDDLSEHRIVGPGRDVRVRAVSAMVYAADELHIGEDRAPRRDEEFNKIANPESRRHWRRHQAVQGPVLRGGELCFDANVGSPAFEKALRKTLRKAFQSVTEATEEFKRSSIEVPPVGIRIRWNRKKTWELLTATSCGDLIPRSAEEIAKKVESLFTELIEGADDVSVLCTKNVDGDSLQTEVQATVSDFITRAFLVENEDGLYVLDGKPRVTAVLFDMARQADELDTLFMGQDAAQHEYRLYQSEFGRRYIREELQPQLEQDYHINVSATPNAQHLKTTLESSPTAARIARLIKPPPGVLVQTDLLEFASIAGICADLINDPELILDTTYRHAATQLFENCADRLPKFLLFIQELAIINKLTLQQVFDATTASAEEKASWKDDASVSFQITQTFPTSRPDWSLGYLMLAGRRAEVSVTIINTEAAPFQFKGPDCEKNHTEGISEEPVAITVGPGQPTHPKTSSFRGCVSFDPDENTLSVEAFKLSSVETAKPLLIQFSPKIPAGTAHVTFRFIDTELTARDISTIREASVVYEKGELTTVMSIEGRQIDLTDELDISKMGKEPWDELVQRLATLDDSIPYPLYLEEEYGARLANCDVTNLQDEFDSVMTERESRRPSLTTIFLRFSTVDSKDYYEEFLGVQPPNFGFNAPTIKGEGISQDDINKQWEAGDKDFRLETSFREDIYQLAKTLRDWIEDVAKPFPFRLDAEDLKFHYSKTRMSITFDRIIDRRWYLERRVTFRFRPVTNSERYGLELEYWKAEGDDRRACLLNELFQNAAAAEANAKRDKDVSDKKPH